MSVRADEKTEEEQEQNLFMVKFEHHLLDNVSLQGIRNVRKAVSYTHLTLPTIYSV